MLCVCKMVILDARLILYKANYGRYALALLDVMLGRCTLVRNALGTTTLGMYPISQAPSSFSLKNIVESKDPSALFAPLNQTRTGVVSTRSCRNRHGDEIPNASLPHHRPAFPAQKTIRNEF